MVEHRVFSRAPIVEALLDIQVTLPEGTTLADIEKFAANLKAEFPERETRYKYESTIEVKSGRPATVLGEHHGPIGYIFRPPSRDRAVQGRLNGFAFSKLRPYSNWDEFREQAQDLWLLYRTALVPTSVRRVALRYINRIEMPIPINSFNDYLLTRMEVAEGLPQGLIDVFSRIVISDEDRKCTAIITSTFEPPDPELTTLPYIFDIDAFVAGEFEVESEKIWQIFEDLREFKNRIFFKSITERSAELFK